MSLNSNKIYLVGVGEYSDYGVHSAWSEKDKAEKLVKILGGSSRVEEYLIDPINPYDFDDMKLFHVYLDSKGDLCDVREASYRDSYFFEADYCETPYGPNGREDPPNTYSYCTCWARDEQHAVKITSEKRAMFIANGG